MKIHNSLPVSGKTTRKNARSRTDGVFGQLLDAEIGQTQAVSEVRHDTSQTPMQDAWHTLEESVSLLDHALQCIEAGDAPPRHMIADIEVLRSRLRQQVASGSSDAELKQADTLLAVEAERIRSMQT